MAEIAKNLILVMVGYLAPLWFPLVFQKLPAGDLNGTEWAQVIFLLILPVAILFWIGWAQKQEAHKELLDTLKDALKASREGKENGS